jgi:hypothetical protein
MQMPSLPTGRAGELTTYFHIFPDLAALADSMQQGKETCQGLYTHCCRPVAVARRAAQVLLTAGWLGSGLLLDRTAGALQSNAPLRAGQVRRAIERLGPAYVKVAQAVSTRVDLLSPAYLAEIERLQDRVPPFPTSEARSCTRLSVSPMAASWQTVAGLLGPSCQQILQHAVRGARCNLRQVGGAEAAKTSYLRRVCRPWS